MGQPKSRGANLTPPPPSITKQRPDQEMFWNSHGMWWSKAQDLLLAGALPGGLCRLRPLRPFSKDRGALGLCTRHTTCSVLCMVHQHQI